MRSSKEAVVSKSLGSTVLGWFVVKEEDEDEAKTQEPDNAVEARLKKSPPPQPEEDAPPSLRLRGGDLPPVAAGAPHAADMFDPVYRAAHITPEAQERVDRARALLESLPADTPKDTRKQIVEASMKAFNIPLDEIIETAAEEIQALEAFIQHGERHTQSVLVDANNQIESLAAKINEIKKLMELQVRTQQGVVRATNEQKLRVQKVLEFFGHEAVARVVEQSPKLVQPR